MQGFDTEIFGYFFDLVISSSGSALSKGIRRVKNSKNEKLRASSFRDDAFSCHTRFHARQTAKLVAPISRAARYFRARFARARHRFYSYHPDESVGQIVGAVVHLLQGDFNPHFFNYPSLSIYATWIVYQFLAVLGLTTNVPDAAYPWPVLRDIIFAGRLFSVVCGAGTAALSYAVARQLGLNRGALVAGTLVALLPGLVQHSHYATVDVPATFFVALCVWLSLRAQTGKAMCVAAKFTSPTRAFAPTFCKAPARARRLALTNRAATSFWLPMGVRAITRRA